MMISWPHWYASFKEFLKNPALKEIPNADPSSI